MEPEDLPWPGELEEEEEEEEEEKEAEEPEEPANLGSEKVVMVEEVEEEQRRRELDSDSNCESPPRESTDEEDDEEAEAWLQAHPAGPLPPSSLSRHRFSENQQPGREQRTESWHYPPQEMDSSHTLDTTQTRFNMREEGTEVTDFPSVEEGILTQPENQVKKSKRDLLCSPLLVIQDNFASPDLPLLTCLTQDQEFESDSLFQPSELEFVPLRGIPGKSEDTEWFSRPSEVSEALFQAASEVASDLGNSCITVSQHSLIASTAVESQHSFLPLEQGTKEETISSDTVDELKTPKDFDSYDALCSYMTWKTQEVQEPETSLTDEGQASVSTSSYTSDEYMTPEGSDSFDASCSYVQFWKQKALQQSEKYLTSKDHHSYADSFDTVDKNTIPKGSDNFSAPFAYMPWSKYQASHRPETCVISKGHVSFPHEVAPHFNNKMSHSFLHCLLESRGKGIPLTAHGHYFESVYVRAPAENEVKEVMNSLEGYERNEEGLGKELSQGFELKENRSALVFSEVHPRSSEIQYCENIVVPGNSVKVSEIHIHSSGHGTSQMEVSGVPLQTIKSTLDQISERLYFQEEGNQRATCVFGGKSVDASENVAFEVVIASIEPSKKENTVNEIQTDISKFLVNDSQEREPKNPHLSLLNYNNENSFFDELSHPCYQSPPGVFELEASKPLLHKKVNGDNSSLYWPLNLKSLPSAPQEMFIKPLSLIPEFKSSASLSEKSHSQAVGLGKAQSALFQCDLDNEPFLPIGKIKSVPALDLAEKVGSSNIFYPMKVSTSDSLVLQDLRRFEEVADSSNYILEGLQGKAESGTYTLDDDTECCNLDENAVVCSTRVDDLQREICEQGDLTSECIELASLKNVLDDLEVCDSSLDWESDLQLPSKEESDFEEPVGHSNTDINQPFSSILPPFIPHEPARELEYHSSDLRMLRVSPDTVQKTLEHSAGDTSKGGIAEITQSSLKPGITTTRESDTGSLLSLFPEDFPQLALRSPQEITIGQHSDTLHQQELVGSHKTEETPKVSTVPKLDDQNTGISTVPSSSYSQRGKPSILHQQSLPDSYLAEEALKVAAVPEPTDQKTSIPTVLPGSYSLGEKHCIFYPQTLPESHLTEEAVRVSAFSGLADQKTDIPTVLPSSYSLREKHNIFYQQALPDSHLTEEAVRVSAVPGPADQKTRIHIVLPGSHSLGEKHKIFCQQALPNSHLTKETLKVSAVPGPVEQKSVIPIVLPGSYLLGEKRNIFHPPTLPESHLTEEAVRVSAAVPGSVDQKTGIPTVLPGSFSLGEKASIFHQQALPESHLTKEALRVSAVPGPIDQKTGIPTVLPGSYSLGENCNIFQPQTLPDGHLTGEAVRVSTVPGPVDQKTGIPTVLSGSYSLGEKRNIFHPQTLPGIHLTEEAQRVLAVPGPADEKTGIPTVLPGSYSLGEKRNIFHPQTLPSIHLTEEAQRVLAVPGPADEKTGIPTGLAGSYSLGEKSNIFYPQTLPQSHLTEEALKVLAGPGPVDQKTGIPTILPGSYSLGERRNIFHPENLRDSHLTEEALRVSGVPSPADQKTDIPAGLAGSYSLGEKRNIFYPQTLSQSHLIEEAIRVSAFPGPADQKTGIPTGLAGSYSLGEKCNIVHSETLPDNHLTEGTQRVLAVPGPVDQKTGIPTGLAGSYSLGEKRNIFHPENLPESPLTEEALKVLAGPGPADQKTGIPIGLPGSYSLGEKHHIFHSENLPDSHLTEEAVRVWAVPSPADQKTGIPTVLPGSYSLGEKCNIFHPENLPDSHLTEEALKVLAVPGLADQKTGIPTVLPGSYSLGEKHHIFHTKNLADNPLTEEGIRVSAFPGPVDQKTDIPTGFPGSYSLEEKSNIVHPEILLDSLLTEEAVRVLAVPGPDDQKADVPTGLPGSYSLGEKCNIVQPETLPDSHLTEEAVRVSAVPGPVDQKTGIPTGLPGSYSLGEKHSIFHPEILPDNHLTEEAVRVLTVPGPPDQKTDRPTGHPGSYSPREKHNIFYPQTLPESPRTEEALRVSAVPGPVDQKTGRPTVLPGSYSPGEKHHILHPETLPDSHLTEESLKISTVPVPTDQRTEKIIVPSASLSQREKHVIFSQQQLSDGDLTAQVLKASVAPGPADQNIGLPTLSSSSYSLGEKHCICYQQALLDSHLIEQAQKVAAVPRPADQKTRIPLASSTSYLQGERPHIFCQQTLPESDLTEQALKYSAPGSAEQKTGIPTLTSTSYSHREKSSISNQQELPDSPLAEQAPKVPAVPGPAEKKSGSLSEASNFSSRREKHSIFYQQEFLGSSLIEPAQKVSPVPGPTDQKPEIPTVTSTYSHVEKPFIFYPQGLPDSPLPEEALKVTAVSEPTDQQTGTPVVPSSSYSPGEKPIIFYPQGLTDVYLTKEALKVSAISGSADWKTGIPTVSSTSYSNREKPIIFYPQGLTDSQLPQEALNISAIPGPADQKTGLPSEPSSSYSLREKPIIFYPQDLTNSQVPQAALKVSAIPGPADQKTGLPLEDSSSYSPREKPIIFYPQGLTDSQLPQAALKLSAIPGPADQKTRLPSEPSSSYSFREKPIIFYPQGLTDSQLPQEALNVSAIPEPADQKTELPSEPSTSYSPREKPSIFYPQDLTDSQLPQEPLNISAIPGPADQKTGLPSESSSSYSPREKPIIFYSQGLIDGQVPQVALKVSATPGLADQKTGLPSEPSSSYSPREKPIIFYPQGLTDSQLPQEALKVSAIPGPGDQKTGLPSEPSSSYKPSIFYPQDLTDSQLLQEPLNISAIPGPADQKTGLPSESSSSYSPREKPIIFYSQGLIDGQVPQVALKVSATPGLADQKTGLPSEPSSSYSPREKPIIFYPQGLTDSHLPQKALKVSAILGPGDQKTGLPSEPSSSYSHREKSNIFYAQEFPGSHLTEEALKVSAFSGIGDQKTGIPTVLSSSYSLGGKPIIFYQQALSDRHLTDEALNVSASSGPADQETGIPTVSSVSYSHRERPSILYQQPFSDNQLAIAALKVSAVSGSDDQKTRKPTITSASYSEREKPIIYHQQLPDLTQESLNVFRIPGLGDQRTGITAVTSTTYSHREKPVISYQQELPAPNEGALKVLGAPGSADQQSGIRFGPSTSYSHRKNPIFSYLESPDITEETLKISAVSGPGDQKTGIHIIPSSSYSYREKDSIFYQEELPDVTEAALKVFALPGPADQKTEIPIGPSSSYSHEEKLKISPVILPDDQETELLTAPLSFYSKREKPKISTVIGSDNQKTPLLTVLHNSYSQKVKPGIFLQHQLSDKHQSENILKISAVSEPIDVNSGIPISLSSSYSHREKSNNFYPQELPDKHLGKGALKVSTIPLPADQKSLLPTAPSSFSHREQPDIFCQQDFPDRHLTQDALMFSSGVGQADQITGLSTVTPGTYSYSEKQKLVSDHVQMLIDNLDSSNSSVTSNSMPLNSQADGRVIISKPESSSFEDVRSEEIQDRSSGSKTLKEIRTLLMEAENIALKRCNFPAPLVPFRDVSDISFIQSKKVVCFKEPLTADEYNGDLPQRQPFIEESPSNKCIQKDISTQTNLKCQRGIENWEFISSTTVRSPLQEAESKARVTVDETCRQYRAAKSVMRSEPEGYSGTIGNKIVIPMMTIIKSDSSSDASSCSWDSNSLESVSDVLLNFFPYSSPKTSLTDSREEGVSESDDGGGSSVDSLAAHVRNLLKCESSLNHAKQILRNAEEEECRVRARAWNLKFNLAHECGYSISELNEDDRRKVEEIKAKLFSHERTTDLSKGLQSPRGIGCKPEAVCSHIIIESHEKGCFRTLTAEQPQLDSHPCVFRSADPSDMIRGQRSPSSWRTRHIDLSKSLDQCNPHFKVWNSLQLRSHSPFQNFAADDFRISQGLRMPFHEKIDPWLSELVEPASVPLEEMDCHSSSQMLPPEPMKKFTTSITFSSHRHSKCFSDSSVLKVGVTEGSQCTGASVGVFNSHFTEEQNPPRDLEQRTSSPSSFKIVSHSPDKAVTILAESSRQSPKLSVEHSQQEEKFLERSDFKSSDSEPSTSTKCSNVKEVHFSDNHTFISMSRPSSTLGVKEKNVTITPDLSSHIILEQRQLFEQSKAPHADHHVRKHHSPPPQHQDYVAPNLPCRIFLEKQELFEQSKAPHLDHQMRENHSPFLQGQDYIASDLPSSIFLEQRQLFEQSKAPDVDHMGKYHSPLPQVQDYVVEKNNQHKFKSYISNMINVEAKFDNVISQSAPSQCTLVTSTSASTPPSNRKALSCFRITLYPKTPSKLDSGTLDKRFHTLDPASKTRMNSEFNSDLQTISSRSLEPTSKLLASKPIAQNQESLGFVGPKSSPDFQVVQSPLPDSNDISQDLKSILFQNSQIVTSKQTQVNISDLEGYSSPEGTPVSADRSSEGIKAPFSAFPGKLSSDAVTQITTESPGKTMFSSEIFINTKDRGLAISEPSTQKLGKGPVKFASSSSVQQITHPHGTDAQPSLLPYKPPGSTKMYYVPELRQIPPSLDSKSDTTVESSHSGSNDAIAPDFPAEVLGTRDDDLTVPANIKHKEGIYSKRVVPKASLLVGRKTPQKDNADAQVQVSITDDENLSDKNQKKEIYTKKAVTKAAQPEEESLQKASKGSSDAAAAEHSARLQDIKLESLPDTKAIKQKEEILNKRTFPKEAWKEDKESLQIDIAESRCHSEFENTTHSVFRSAKFYFHHPVHLPSDQDFCHESLGRSVFMRHSLKDFFQHHPDKQREHTSLPSPRQNVEKTKTDYTRIESLSINVNLENDVMHTAKSRARDNPKSDKQLNDQKRDHKVTPEPTAQHTVSLNELWNRYQERQRQQRPPQFGDRKELSLVDRLDRLAKLLQNPITYSLRTSESTQDDSRGERDVKEWSGRQQQQKSKLQKKKRYKSLEKFHKNAGELKKSKMLSTHQAGKSNQIKIEQIKFDKYILRKQPDFHYRNNTSSDSRPSEESELLTDTATNLLSTTTSPVESDILTQTDREVTLQERSSSISTIDTARLIQAFGHERVCLSPRQIKLYSSITDHQRRYLERRSKKNKKALNMNHPQMTSEHTRRKHIQVADHVISSDSVSSSTSSFWSSSSTLCNMQNVQMLNKAVQAGNLEIVNGVKKHTRDVGMTFPTPSSSEARIEEDSDMTSWSEEKIEEKRLLTNYLGDKKLRKNKHSCCEGVSWFVPVENVKSEPKKENLPKLHGPGICWFAPITNTKPWREPLREQNWQGQHVDGHRPLAGPDRERLRPFVRATLQESLHLHRPDFISRSGERIKRLKLIVQERKLQNMLESEREALFNVSREWQGYRDPTHLLPKKGFLDARKSRPIGKKEMIQRSKRIYEQLPEVQRKREEEKRRLEYKSYRLRAQLFKKKVTNQLLGRKVPWN
uniref:ALMS motif domain-containing protein n=1 Tax=Canis lupus familiaris TaxID=9615 RepID=A0A8C0SV01_CANLF